MDNEKVSIDWGGVRGAAWTGAGGVIAFKKGFFTVRVPRPMIDNFFKYLATGTVQ